jgi:hypothetical protein
MGNPKTLLMLNAYKLGDVERKKAKIAIKTKTARRNIVMTRLNNI